MKGSITAFPEGYSGLEAVQTGGTAKLQHQAALMETRSLPSPARGNPVLQGSHSDLCVAARKAGCLSHGFPWTDGTRQHAEPRRERLLLPVPLLHRIWGT